MTQSVDFTNRPSGKFRAIVDSMVAVTAAVSPLVIVTSMPLIAGALSSRPWSPQEKVALSAVDDLDGMAHDVNPFSTSIGRTYTSSEIATQIEKDLKIVAQAPMLATQGACYAKAAQESIGPGTADYQRAETAIKKVLIDNKNVNKDRTFDCGLYVLAPKAVIAEKAPSHR